MPRPARASPSALLPLTVVAAALLLRGWSLGSQGLDHFDEGVYALSARALAVPGAGLYPDQALFSPPLYFGLVGLLGALTGLALDAAAVAVNVALGTATVAAVGWLGSRWFGRAAGWSAAALLALCEYHVGLSRTALTDVAFALLFTLAFAAVVEALRGGGPWRVLLAGLAVGLAWNTKYHGWLAAAVVGPAALVWIARERERGRLRRVVLVLGGLTLVAALCYAPWALYVESRPGGYAGLARYQSGMLRPGWVANLVRQARFQLLLDGPWSRAALPSALAVGFVLARRGGGPAAAAGALALGLAALLLGSPVLVALLAAGGALLLLRREHGLPGLALVAWLAVWFLLTPLYRPYARLVLPGVVAACFAAGVALDLAVRRAREGGLAGPVAALLVAASAVALGRGAAPTGDPWRSRDGLRRASAQMVAAIPPGEPVYVLGEPALGAYLLDAQRRAVAHVSGRELPAVLERADAPVWVVTGRYARSSGAQAALEERFAERLGATLRLPFVPGDQRVLDDEDPWNARAYRAAPDGRYDLLLRRVAPIR